MPGIAPTRANAPRTASAVLFFWAPGKPAAQRCAAWCGLPVACLLACLLGGGLPWPALAQDTIYRCGREYTNAPNDPVRCERLADQAVTVGAIKGDYRSTPGLKPLKNLSLGVSNRLNTVKKFYMRWRNCCDQRDIWPHKLSERG